MSIDFPDLKPSEASAKDGQTPKDVSTGIAWGPMGTPIPSYLLDLQHFNPTQSPNGDVFTISPKPNQPFEALAKKGERTAIDSLNDV
jgi:hypothetical protein